MSNLLYTENNQLNLSNLIDGYELPQVCRAKSSEYFQYVYEFVSENYIDSKVYKRSLTHAINTLTYIIFTNDSLPFSWDKYHPLDNLPEIDEETLQITLGKYYLYAESICWDVNASSTVQPSVSTVHQVSISTVNNPLSQHTQQKLSVYNQQLQKQDTEQVSVVNKLTPMEDILLDPGLPFIPIIDMNDPWFYTVDDNNEKFVIYKSLPLVPECQSDITVSTEVNSLLPSELLKLYPNHIMKLRHQSMYIKHSGYEHLEYDDELGVILPIPGFTRQQVLDNIIKYPDLINIGPGRIGRRNRGTNGLVKEVVWEPFEHRMEVNGELIKVNGATWNSIPELQAIPPTAAFRQEYVVRKYLLERDNGVQHEKEMFGTLYPFITLFMPMEEYIKRGYKDVEQIAVMCARSRVSYHRSRNPMLLRLGLQYNYNGELIS